MRNASGIAGILNSVPTVSGRRIKSSGAYAPIGGIRRLGIMRYAGKRVYEDFFHTLQ